MSVVTRFAPSPTGFLHIGGARTALFNWLLAQHHQRHGSGGRMLLRIEDTDRARSTQEAVDAIIEGMEWLGLAWDGDWISQAGRLERHKAAVEKLLAEDKAYRCWAGKEELDEMREKAKAEGRSLGYDGRWRDRDPSEAPAGVDPVVRFKAPREGETTIHDQVQGAVTVANAQLDDMVLMRSDGTPTYMLAVVVDDIDMGVTHIIRGDDHLNNAFRQLQLFRALGAPDPIFGHVPLIHGPDGAKLSKRHGALGVEAYRDMGYLPEALRNYLMRLGWGHGDEEIIPTDQAIDLFSLGGIGKAASRFDFKKLEAINGHYIRAASPTVLATAVEPFLERTLGRALTDTDRDLLERALPGLQPRAKTLIELAENAAFYFAARPLPMTEKATKQLTDESRTLLGEIIGVLEPLEWNEAALETAIKGFAESRGMKLGTVMQPMRSAVTGTHQSPSVFEVLIVLGREESLARLNDQTPA